MSIAVKVGRQ